MRAAYRSRHDATHTHCPIVLAVSRPALLPFGLFSPSVCLRSFRHEAEEVDKPIDDTSCSLPVRPLITIL